MEAKRQWHIFQVLWGRRKNCQPRILHQVLAQTWSEKKEKCLRIAKGISGYRGYNETVLKSVVVMSVQYNSVNMKKNY